MQEYGSHMEREKPDQDEGACTMNGSRQCSRLKVWTIRHRQAEENAVGPSRENHSDAGQGETEHEHVKSGVGRMGCTPDQ